MLNCHAVFVIGYGNVGMMLCTPSTWSWAIKHPIQILSLLPTGMVELL